MDFKTDQKVRINIPRMELAGVVLGTAKDSNLLPEHCWVTIRFECGAVGTYHCKNVEIDEKAKEK